MGGALVWYNETILCHLANQIYFSVLTLEEILF